MVSGVWRCERRLCFRTYTLDVMLLAMSMYTHSAANNITCTPPPPRPPFIHHTVRHRVQVQRRDDSDGTMAALYGSLLTLW